MLARLEDLAPGGHVSPLDDGLRRALDLRLERPALHPETEIAGFDTRWGERSAVIRNPSATRYLRLSGPEAAIADRLDGRASLGELATEALGDDRFDLDDILDVVALLESSDMLDRRRPDLFGALAERLATSSRRMLDRVWGWLRRQTVPLPGADRAMGAMYRAGAHRLFSAPATVVSPAIIALGIVAFGLLARRGDYALTGDVSAHTALSLIALALAALCVHEVGHALAVKHAGRSIVGAGVQLYLGHPAFFVDSSDLLLAPRRARIINALAGPYAEAVVASAAALAAFVLPESPAAPILFRFAGITYLSVLINLVPFVELDGYWLLSDVLDIPRLRQRAAAVLRHEIPARLRRHRPRLTGQEWWLAGFGIAAVVVTAGALATAWVFWGPVITRIAGGLWRAGPAGRAVGIALALLVAGPLAHAAWHMALQVGRRVRASAADVRFRLQTRWRVEAAEVIAALPALQHALDDEDLADIAGRVTRRRVREGWTVVHQGDPPDGFYVVRSGRLIVVDHTGAGGELPLRRLAAGDAFGELAIAEKRLRTATVRAESDCELFVLDASTFRRRVLPRMTISEPARTSGPVLELMSSRPFRHLGQHHAATLAARGEWVNARPGEVVVGEGRQGDGFYLLVSGQADVLKAGATVGALRRGDSFGEIALLHNVPRTATVRATTPARLFRIDADTFHEFVAASFRRSRARDWEGYRDVDAHR